MSEQGPETEEELRERCIDMTMEDLVEALVEKHNQLGETSKIKEELFVTKASKEAAEKKTKNLESESHSLLSRAMQAEEKLVELSSKLEALQTEHSDLVENAGDHKANAEELAKLREEVDSLKDAKTLVEQERQKAAEHNELRLSVEHAFNELSRQHEDLLKQLEAAQAEARALRGKAQDDANLIVQLTEERDRLKEQLAAANKETEAANAREQAAKDELAELRKKAAAWKKDAERVLALESKCDSLTKANQKQADEIKNLQAALKQAQLDALRFEEERKKWLEEQRKAKADKFLKQQLSELTLKLQNHLEKEKSWLKERAELQAKIKRLMWELGKKNPSQLRMMEMEVQNQLLIGMLQHTGPNSGTTNSPSKAKGKAKFGGSPMSAPKVLPPLDKTPTNKKSSLKGGSSSSLSADATGPSTGVSFSDNDHSSMESTKDESRADVTPRNDDSTTSVDNNGRENNSNLSNSDVAGSSSMYEANEAVV